MAKKANTEKTSNPNVSPSAMNAPLERAKDKFAALMVIGITSNGVLDIETDMSSYPHMQHLLNRASFELFIHENKAEAAQARANAEGAQVA